MGKKHCCSIARPVDFIGLTPGLAGFFNLSRLTPNGYTIRPDSVVPSSNKIMLLIHGLALPAE
jgi:hypothetical protein